MKKGLYCQPKNYGEALAVISLAEKLGFLYWEFGTFKPWNLIFNEGNKMFLNEYGFILWGGQNTDHLKKVSVSKFCQSLFDKHDKIQRKSS